MKFSRLRIPSRACLIAVLACLASPAPAQKPLDSWRGDLPVSPKWKDTGLEIHPGDDVEITATGQLQYTDAREPAGPEGLPRAWKDLLRALPFNAAGRGALLARIGDSDAARPFLAGTSQHFTAQSEGRLFLGINQTSSDTGEGSYHVEVNILGRLSFYVPGLAETLGLQLDISKLLDKIPRRVADARGDPGDMTNFLLVGSQDALRQAFAQAGWVTVDRTKKEAVLHGIIASLSKEAYVQMPMSELYLFGRPQDFGFALAEPFEVVYQRHHNRVWKSAFTSQGQPVWVGAATHDVGLERDQRTGKLTHKIDPDVDKERDFLRESLTATGLVEASGYATPSQPVHEARTATGGSFHSDGRVLVLRLRSSSARAPNSPSAPGLEPAAAFAAVFCTVLEQQHPDRGPWGPCPDYLEDPPDARVALGAIPTRYRLAIIPGLLSSCTSFAPTFKEGQEHLRKTYGLTVDALPAPNRTSAENGKDIAQFIKSSYGKDGRKFILIAYSKGAPDALEGLAADPQAAQAVAALITVAGAIGGSPIADIMPAQVEHWLSSLGEHGCQGDLAGALKSLRRKVRREFLERHPHPGFPVYSIVAVSDRTNTSKLLLEPWILLSFFGSREDSLIESDDAVFPGGILLGAARADHWAVALPFEDLSDPHIKSLVNHNHYPRTALLESLVRYVTADLAAADSSRVSRLPSR